MDSKSGWALAPTGTDATGASRNRPALQRRHVRRFAATAITALLASTLVPVGSAFAATPPAVPNNITIFPDRDFVVADYPTRNGQTATVTVRRAGVITGSAVGTIANGLLEVNHPGGVCWGTNPAVVAAATPDIAAGDVVSVSFPDGTTDTATTQSPTVTSFSQPDANTIVILGDLTAVGGPAAITGNFEQRIIEPALVNTDVGRRDVRALPGPLTAAVTGGYSSGVAFTATTFTATYNFDLAATAAIAAGGQMRAMTWMTTDAAGNRQGITISEFGEVGGPGIGGCPLTNPGAVAPSRPGIGIATADSAAAASAVVRWTRPIQGSAAITSYSIQVLNASGLQVGALRTSLEPGTASGLRAVRVGGLINGQSYHFQVRATNAVGVGPFSPASNVVTPRTTPSAPMIGIASRGAIGGAITAVARWTPPSSSGGSAVNGYVVTALRINAAGQAVWQTSSPVLTHGVRSLNMVLPKGNYRFFVRARNAVGMSPQSARSNVVAAL